MITYEQTELTPELAAELLAKTPSHQRKYEQVAPQVLAIRRSSRINAIPVMAVHILASRNVDPDKASLWLSGLETGEDLAKGDPRLVLRNRFIADGGHPIRSATQQWALTVKAWNAWLADTEVRSLRHRKIDALPVPVGAEVRRGTLAA